MSLKPKKKSDLKYLQNKFKIKNKEIESKIPLPKYTMIVCEGTKTEPNYLNGFVSIINNKYKEITKKNHINICGIGQNTIGLIDYVDNKIRKGQWNNYKVFWLVYDKDDFPEDDFDNTEYKAEKRTDVEMSVAWSNESIELWFVWHFQDYFSNNGRQQYISILKKYFDYSKNSDNLYDEIMNNGSLKNAKRRAERAYNEFKSKNFSPYKMVPATRMFELIEYLEQYI